MRRTEQITVELIVIGVAGVSWFLGGYAGVALGSRWFGPNGGATPLVGVTAAFGLPIAWLTCALALAQERGRRLQATWEAPFAELGFDPVDRRPTEWAWRRPADGVEVALARSALEILVIEVRVDGHAQPGAVLVPDARSAAADRPALASVGAGFGTQMVRSRSFESAAKDLFGRAHDGQVSLSTAGSRWIWRWIGWPLDADPVLSAHNLAAWIAALAAIDAVPGPWRPPKASC